jgi:IS30 family transposase
MPGKTLTPEQIADPITLREAGYTLAAISEALGASVSTLQRHLKRHAARKGRVKADLVDEARKALLARVTSDDAIRREAAQLIADDLAHTALLRKTIATASEQLTASKLVEAALVMRAAAAYSTALKNTSDMLRHVMRFDKAADRVAEEDLPELTVREITPGEMAQLKSNGSEESQPCATTDLKMT